MCQSIEHNASIIGGVLRIFFFFFFETSKFTIIMTLINNFPSLLEYLIRHNRSIIGEKWSIIDPGLVIVEGGSSDSGRWEC